MIAGTLGGVLADDTGQVRFPVRLGGWPTVLGGEGLTVELPGISWPDPVLDDQFTKLFHDVVEAAEVDGTPADAVRVLLAELAVERLGLTAQIDLGSERSRRGHLLWLQGDGHRRPGQ